MCEHYHNGTKDQKVHERTTVMRERFESAESSIWGYQGAEWDLT